MYDGERGRLDSAAAAAAGFPAILRPVDWLTPRDLLVFARFLHFLILFFNFFSFIFFCFCFFVHLFSRLLSIGFLHLGVSSLSSTDARRWRSRGRGEHRDDRAPRPRVQRDRESLEAHTTARPALARRRSLGPPADRACADQPEARARARYRTPRIFHSGCLRGSERVVIRE